MARLTTDERRTLDNDYVSSWHGRYLSEADQRQLKAMLSSGSDVNVIISALQSSNLDEKHRVGVQVAAEALGTALKRVGQRAADERLPGDERQAAEQQLANLAESPGIANLLLDVPGGERLLHERLGLSNTEIVHYRLLRVGTGTELMAVLRGLHGSNIRNLLELPDVRAHLEAKGLAVEPHMMRVLDAYAQLADTPFEPVSFVAGVPGVLRMPDLSGRFATGQETAGTLRLGPSLPQPDPTAPDPTVIIAAHRAFEAAAKNDLAGVVAAVRPLRGSQRLQLQGEPYFAAALAALRSRPSSVVIANLLADPFADPARAAEALVAAGVTDEYGAVTVLDERMLAQGLAADPADRRLMRYRYVQDALAAEPPKTRLRSGVPADLDFPQDIDTAYEKRTSALAGVEAVPRLRAEQAFLGEPEIMRDDITPEEAALEAEFMRVRLEKQLKAAAGGIDVTGIFGWSPETVSEEAAEFRRVWELHGEGLPWTQPDLVRLAAAYYDALEAIDRNRTARDEAAAFVGNLAATVAGVVAVIATGGAATPAVLQLLAATAFGGTAQMLVAEQLRDYTAPEQQAKDFGTGAVTGFLTAAGNLMARPAVAFLDKRMAGYVAKNAVNKVLGTAAKLAVEGAIDGAVGGAGQAIFETALDRATWEHGVMAAFARFLKAAGEGALIGGVMGGVAAPAFAGAFAGAGYLVRTIGGGRAVSKEVAAALRRIELMADEGHFELALRHLDALELGAAQREKMAAGLLERSLKSTAGGIAIPEDMLHELERARQMVREIQASGVAGKRLDVSKVEELLARLENRLDAAEITHVRKLLYSEIRLSPQELIIKQNLFRAGLDDAVTAIATPAERAAMPAYEVRVLSPEAFEGMFRSEPGQALTILEGNRAVVYVRSDAAVRTHMMQEAAHLAQFADPDLAAQARLLRETNLAGWADKAAADRLYFLDVQRNLEIDAQERIIRALQPEEGFAGPEVHELAAARERLEELRLHDAQAKAITPDQLADMNAGLHDMPDWMEEEARLFGKSKDTSKRPPQSKKAGTPRKVESAAVRGPNQVAEQLGNEWPETTIVTTDIEGKVTAIETVGNSTVVTVTPEGGGAPRTYTLDRPRKQLAMDIRVGSRVDRNDRLGSWSQKYRRVRVREGSKVVRMTEEVLDRNGTWVERGTFRTTRGSIMEAATQLQVESTLRGPSFVLKRGTEAAGFDRVVVEFSGRDKDMKAVIRVLEVKDYPTRYVPFAEFTAIVENFDQNLADTILQLRAEVGRLQGAGNRDAANALTRALNAQSVQVEIWLGPTTRLGEERLAESVMSKLRQSVEKGNITLAPAPHNVDPGFQQQAVKAWQKKYGK